MKGDNASKVYHPQFLQGLDHSASTSNQANIRDAMKSVPIRMPTGSINLGAMDRVYRMVQDMENIQATNLGWKNSPTLTTKYLDEYKTDGTSASIYGDPPAVETPQSLPSWVDSNIETGQMLSGGYTLGETTDQGFNVGYFGKGTGQEVLKNWNMGGWLGSGVTAANYQRPEFANYATNHRQELPAQELANFYPIEMADPMFVDGGFRELVAVDAVPEQQGIQNVYTSPAGDSWGVESRQALVETSRSEGSGSSQQNQRSTTGLTAVVRADLWPKEHEDFLMMSKSANRKFSEISAAMARKYGIQRSPNVLSKRYRLILERDAEDSGIMQLLKGATPKLLRVLQDEMEKIDPEVMNEELRHEVWEELQRKLPKAVRSLALQTRTGA